MGFTVDLFQSKTVSGRDVLDRVMKRLAPLLVASFMVILPLAGIVYGLLDSGKDQAAVEWTILKIVGLILLIPLSLMLEFIPIEVMAGDLSSIGVLKRVFRFLKEKLGLVLLFTLLIVLFMFMTLFVAQVLALIPIFGEGLLANLAMGVGYTFVYVMTGVFYLSMTAPNVDVQISPPN